MSGTDRRVPPESLDGVRGGHAFRAVQVDDALQRRERILRGGSEHGARPCDFERRRAFAVVDHGAPRERPVDGVLDESGRLGQKVLRAGRLGDGVVRAAEAVATGGEQPFRLV
jgi:hypothetical protein